MDTEEAELIDDFTKRTDKNLKKAARRKETSSIYHFDIYFAKDLITFGIITMIFPATLLVWFILQYRHDPDFLDLMLFPIIWIAVLSIFLILPIHWVYSIRVDDKTITRKKFGIKTSWDISRIDYCRKTTGELRVYMKGHRHCSLLIDNYCVGQTNFIKRMQKEGIPITE